MRVWLQKQKKKEEARVAAQVATPPVEAPMAAPEVQPVGESVEKPMECVGEAIKADNLTMQPTSGATDDAEVDRLRAGSASAQPNEVGLPLFSLSVSFWYFYRQLWGGKAGKNAWIGTITEVDATIDSKLGVRLARLLL